MASNKTMWESPVVNHLLKLLSGLAHVATIAVVSLLWNMSISLTEIRGQIAGALQSIERESVERKLLEAEVRKSQEKLHDLDKRVTILEK